MEEHKADFEAWRKLLIRIVTVETKRSGRSFSETGGGVWEGMRREMTGAEERELAQTMDELTE